MEKREKEIAEKTIKILAKRLNPSKIILFGSRAKGTADKHADFDFAVDCKKPDISVQRHINEDIEEVCGLYKVDIVYMTSADNEFKNIILKTGKVVYERRT